MAAGPCAKRDVTCIILSADHKSYWTGRNLCMNAQEVCPREEGEDYSKCDTVCQTIGHAEAVAVRQVPEGAADGGEVHLFGHYRICDDCAQKLIDVGVAQAFIHEPSPEPVLVGLEAKKLILPGVA
jgi:deoxycytidylate deaminase